MVSAHSIFDWVMRFSALSFYILLAFICVTRFSADVDVCDFAVGVSQQQDQNASSYGSKIFNGSKIFGGKIFDFMSAGIVDYFGSEYDPLVSEVANQSGLAPSSHSTSTTSDVYSGRPGEGYVLTSVIINPVCDCQDGMTSAPRVSDSSKGGRQCSYDRRQVSDAPEPWISKPRLKEPMWPDVGRGTAIGIARATLGDVSPRW